MTCKEKEWWGEQWFLSVGKAEEATCCNGIEIIIKSIIGEAILSIAKSPCMIYTIDRIEKAVCVPRRSIQHMAQRFDDCQATTYCCILSPKFDVVHGVKVIGFGN